MPLTIADCSEFQGSIDWAAYGAANPAVIVRAHNGSRADYRWPANLAGARTHCRWRGWYQYLNAGQDAAAAARGFAATVGALLPGEVMILDLEAGTGDQRGRRRAWYDALAAHPRWTYSGAWFARTSLPGVALDWVASYGSSEPAGAHTLWQFSDRQRFAGIATPCDASTYHGTVEQLLALTGGISTASTAPTAPAPQDAPRPATTKGPPDMVFVTQQTRGVWLFSGGFTHHLTPTEWNAINAGRVTAVIPTIALEDGDVGITRFDQLRQVCLHNNPS